MTVLITNLDDHFPLTPCLAILDFQGLIEACGHIKLVYGQRFLKLRDGRYLQKDLCTPSITRITFGMIQASCTGLTRHEKIGFTRKLPSVARSFMVL